MMVMLSIQYDGYTCCMVMLSIQYDGYPCCMVMLSIRYDGYTCCMAFKNTIYIVYVYAIYDLCLYKIRSILSVSTQSILYDVRWLCCAICDDLLLSITVILELSIRRRNLSIYRYRKLSIRRRNLSIY